MDKRTNTVLGATNYGLFAVDDNRHGVTLAGLEASARWLEAEGVAPGTVAGGRSVGTVLLRFPQLLLVSAADELDQRLARRMLLEAPAKQEPPNNVLMPKSKLPPTPPS